MRDASARLSSMLMMRCGAITMLGGLLWAPYGVFEMLEPWGTDTVYRDDLGYEVVTDTARFVAYSLPGSLALLLTSLGLLALLALLELPESRWGQIARFLVYIAAGLATMSLLGVILRFDPVFTTSRIVGTLALGFATCLAAFDAHKGSASPGWARVLAILGAGGIVLLPLWPLVHAVQWLPEAVGAGIIALFGLGWLAVGYQVRAVRRSGSETTGRNRPDEREQGTHFRRT